MDNSISRKDDHMKTRENSILKKKHQEFVLNRELIKMVEIGDLTEVMRLIGEGATLHKLNGSSLHLYLRNSECDTLLHTAAKLGHVDIVNYLIHCGCDINAQTRRCKASPLHYATYTNVPSAMLDILLDNGAEINIKDDDQASPFMWACYLNNTRAIKILIDRKANVYDGDNFGLSPLEWASHQGNLEAVILLINSIVYTKSELKSAYTYAIENGQTPIAKFLEKKIS